MAIAYLARTARTALSRARGAITTACRGRERIPAFLELAARALIDIKRPLRDGADSRDTIPIAVVPASRPRWTQWAMAVSFFGDGHEEGVFHESRPCGPHEIPVSSSWSNNFFRSLHIALVSTTAQSVASRSASNRVGPRGWNDPRQ